MSELLWTDRDWLEQASRWLRMTLGRRGIVVTGEIEQARVRPWATALRVPTESGDVWFKASIPVLSQEAAVTQVLARHRPDCTPEILAADPERGWILIRDAGPPLEELLGSAAYADRWEEALALYAELQIDLAEHVDELLAAGAVDRRLRTLPSLYEAVLSEPDALRIGLPDGLTEEQAEELRKLGPQLPTQAAELAAYGIPERSSMTTSATLTCECVALRLGKLFRAFSYHLTIPNLPPAHRAEHADAVPGWLQIFLLDD